WPHTTTRRLILQKARHHNPQKGRSDGLTAHGFRYSFTTPHRGPFHLSLTVLVHYRSPGRILACRVVLADSHGIPRPPRYSAPRPRPDSSFTYGTLTHSGTASQRLRLENPRTLRAGRPEKDAPYNPTHATTAVSHTHMV